VGGAGRVGGVGGAGRVGGVGGAGRGVWVAWVGHHDASRERRTDPPQVRVVPTGSSTMGVDRFAT
jgi:hypothetical protein